MAAPPPNGMGKKLNMSKSLQPHAFGEDLMNSTRTQILLRAWMVWRARAHGFADNAISRKRVFDDESDKIVRDSVNPQSAYMDCVPNAYAEPSVKA